MSHGWDYAVRVYAGVYHPRAPAGTLLIETRHMGSSKDAEVSAVTNGPRPARGEVSKIEVIDLRKRTTETITFPTPKRRPKGRL